MSEKTAMSQPSIVKTFKVKNAAIQSEPKANDAEATLGGPVNDNQVKPEMSMPEQITVNGKVISEQSIADEIQYHPAESLENARSKAINALVIRELFSQRAAVLNIEAKGEDQRFDAVIAQDVVCPEVSEQECLGYFEKNADKFRSTDIFEVSHILLAVPADDAQGRFEIKTQAEAIIEQLKASPHLFAQLARQYSACPSKETDGNLGQLSKGQTVPEFERQLAHLEAGLSPYPIESRYGFHIVNVNRCIRGKPLTFEMVKDKVKQFLHDSVYQRSLNQYIHRLIAFADISGVEMAGDKQAGIGCGGV